MTQRLGPCPQNCPDRYANEHETCHSTCQTYMRYKLMRLLMNKQRMKAVDEVGFHRDVRQAVKRKHERKIRYIEGYINISNNSTDELVVTAKVGEDSYKVNYVYLNDYTLYVVEDISGTHTDPYHYKLYFNTNVLPEVELKP